MSSRYVQLTVKAHCLKGTSEEELCVVNKETTTKYVMHSKQPPTGRPFALSPLNKTSDSERHCNKNKSSLVHYGFRVYIKYRTAVTLISIYSWNRLQASHFLFTVETVCKPRTSYLQLEQFASLALPIYSWNSLQASHFLFTAETVCKSRTSYLQLEQFPSVLLRSS